MISRALLGLAAAALLASPGASQEVAGNPNQPPEHKAPFPNLGTGQSRAEAMKSFELAPHMQRGVPAKDMLEQQRRLDKALGALQPQRPGTVDAYVLTVALDSDPVFAREAREAERVLSRRYGAEGRSLVLAGPDGKRDDLPKGSIRSFLIGLARIAEVMDAEEDVLVLYTTSHGAKVGLVNHYGDTGYGIFSPTRLKETLEDLGIERRLLIISACYSGVFVEPLKSPDTAILTAASAERNSFGCVAENDWTFYGDALINNALRKPQSLADAADEATLKIAGWETDRRLLASLPQTAIGADVDEWLDELESRTPQVATTPVGRPAIGE
ncbi:C13 family peptidase [Erythrobacter sp. THAF29]|uniref:C13 family peptidase n=1 Tax=Erythrobacter sp. THAF29 TaxID=2587851 RepID=UPI0012688106|nr:C13 family peptidase [Erythrobacter sp. THAF29]QFT78081.1 Peptidase C13 family protein [Erythrobacter sp. THAF29]